MAIIVKNLCKNFEYYKKGLGFKKSIQNLFHREMLIKEAVKNLSFEIDSGEFVGFLGPNGAGKTTTLKIMSGILYPTSGTVNVDSFVPWERKKEFKKHFSIVMGQKSQLWTDLPANESLNLNKYIYEIDDKEYQKNVEELSELLDAKDIMQTQVRKLSLGERMKLELIASLIHSPNVLFLDEPTIGLDFISQKRIREFLKYYNEQKKATIILTSHYINDIEALCNRTIIINSGNLVFDGEIGDITRQMGNKKNLKIQFRDIVEQNRVEKYGTVKKYDGHSVLLEVDGEYLKEHIGDIFRELPIVDYGISDLPIEDGIIRMYQQGGEHDEKN